MVCFTEVARAGAFCDGTTSNNVVALTHAQPDEWTRRYEVSIIQRPVGIAHEDRALATSIDYNAP